MSFTFNFFAYFKFHSDWGRVIGKIKQNELDFRDTAPLNVGYVPDRKMNGLRIFTKKKKNNNEMKNNNKTKKRQIKKKQTNKPDIGALTKFGIMLNVQVY